MSRRIGDYIRQHHIALLALFIALSGTAYAVDGPLPGQNQVGSEDIINGEVKTSDLGTDSVASAKIVDRQVKNADLSIGASSSNTIADGGIQGIDVKNDALTGTQIDESTLSGFLPSADVQLVDFRSTEGGGDGSILNLGGLNLAANCNDVGAGGGDLQWFYSSAVNNASLHVSFSVAGDPNAKTLVNDNLDTGVSIDPFPGSSNDDDLAGTLVYTRPDGGSVSVDFQQEDSEGVAPEALGGSLDCLFTGVAVRAGP
jgi:hypothetical protein